MDDFVEIDPDNFNHSPFRLIGKDWMLMAAEKDGKTNAMTAAWGGMGVMWRKPVTFAVVRPQRFTKEFVDAASVFSLNFFNSGERREMLNYMGTASGRDEDKIASTGLTVKHVDGAPAFAEAETIFICRKLFAQPYDPASFIDASIDGDCYPGRDYHTLYISEVVRILEKRSRG